MNKIFTLTLLFLFPFIHLCQAQYTGGVGRGDASAFVSSDLNGLPVGLKGQKQEHKEALQLVINPNPSNGSFEVYIHTNDEASYTWWLQDLSSRMTCLPQQDYRNRFSISTEMAPGIYFLHLVKGNEKVIKKVVIR
jgi:hypothetical protein